jgi:tryptophan-rich sensory protein
MSLIPTNFSQGNNIIRLLYPMIIGYIISYQCKMNKSDGSIAKFRPPPIVFGIVWPILYILIGLSWITAVNSKTNKYTDIIYFILSSLLAMWLIVYACLKDKQSALYILLLTLLSISILMIIGPKNSQFLLSPLLIWIFYAILLSTTSIQNS